MTEVRIVIEAVGDCTIPEFVRAALRSWERPSGYSFVFGKQRLDYETVPDAATLTNDLWRTLLGAGDCDILTNEPRKAE